jgi:hypothetical protein
MLMTRDEFRNAVFPDGGYYLDNGASLCGEHHIEAEQTVLTCEQVRTAAKIEKVVLPPHLYRDHQYDKWGNVIQQNGMRLKGELFEDASIQKVLSKVIHLFTDKVKYPRTYHLPWSPGVLKDDKVMTSLDGFQGREVIVTVKMDGENTSIYPDYVHARSIDYSKHDSRNLVKVLASKIGYEIPKGWRICGENVYAKHTIEYNNLEDYFLMFSIWNNQNMCLSWDETKDYAELFGLKTVPELWRGIWDEEIVKHLYQEMYNGDKCEGYVVRVVDGFHYKDFRNVVGKYVRRNHVQTVHHWMAQAVVPNKVKQNA